MIPKSTIGALQYVLIARSKLAFSVNKVTQFMHNSHDHYWKAVKQILRHLKGALDQCLIINCSNNTNIEGFCYLNWASDIDDKKSITGYCVYFGTNIVSWSSHNQKAISRSITETEYHEIVVVLADIYGFNRYYLNYVSAKKFTKKFIKQPWSYYPLF